LKTIYTFNITPNNTGGTTAAINFDVDIRAGSTSDYAGNLITYTSSPNITFDGTAPGPVISCLTPDVIPSATNLYPTNKTPLKMKVDFREPVVVADVDIATQVDFGSKAAFNLLRWYAV
jgi:hypothetical protein